MLSNIIIIAKYTINPLLNVYQPIAFRQILFVLKYLAEMRYFYCCFSPIITCSFSLSGSPTTCCNMLSFIHIVNSRRGVSAKVIHQLLVDIQGPHQGRRDICRYVQLQFAVGLFVIMPGLRRVLLASMAAAVAGLSGLITPTNSARSCTLPDSTHGRACCQNCLQ